MHIGVALVCDRGKDNSKSKSFVGQQHKSSEAGSAVGTPRVS